MRASLEAAHAKQQAVLRELREQHSRELQKTCEA